MSEDDIKDVIKEISDLRLGDALEALRDERDLLLARVEDDSEEGRPIVMSECALEDRDFRGMQLRSDSGCFSGQALDELRQAALQCPRPIAGALRQALEEHHVYARPVLAMPQWARTVTAHREAFEQCVLVDRVPCDANAQARSVLD